MTNRVRHALENRRRLPGRLNVDVSRDSAHGKEAGA
jgi:hypothetical protein